MDWHDVRKSITKTGVAIFGQSVSYRPKNGGEIPIKGVLSSAWIEIPTAGVPVSGLHTVLDIDLSELPAKPANGDKVLVGATMYKIIDSRDDGGGGARLVLQRS